MKISVKALCAFGARSGDLDHRFTPAPTALDGVRGHQIIAARRDADHASEVALTGHYGDLIIRGRADGVGLSPPCVEEVKTHRGPIQQIPPNQTSMHWAQAKVYAHLLCSQHVLSAADVRLLYFDPFRDRETPLTQHCSADNLRREFEALCARFMNWAKQEAAHRTALLQALHELSFPYAMRAGQRELARQVFMAARRRMVLLAQAPTGIGKTLGTLFPMLKAMAEEHVDRIFYLTQKTTGRALALDALDRLKSNQPGLPLRVVELVARETACVHPESACHGESCPRAKGFYDRLPAARQQAVQQARTVTLRGSAVAHIAEIHNICPYYLTQELVRWADVVVADVNHWFDSSAVLYALTQSEDWRVGLLVDEAHNLVDRARGMYSASLSSRDLQAFRGQVPPPLKAAVTRLRQRWNVLQERHSIGFTEIEPDACFSEALQQFTSRVTDYLAEHADQVSQAVFDLYFPALQLTRLAETFGDHSLCYINRQGGALTKVATGELAIRNVVPAPYTTPRLAAAATVVLFSATLQPQAYYADLLGLPSNHVWLDVPSPFDPQQLHIRLVSVSTRWGDRANSVEPITEVIARQYDERQGNYLAFFSSFHYLGQVVEHLRRMRPDLPIWVQEPGMTEAARRAFIDRFEPQGRGVGFGVLGGAFAEAMDLPGSRLIGAFIATLGLPPAEPLQQAMQGRIDARWPGRGYDYMSLVPGVRKVVQAAGRVIRGEFDEGVLYLIDDRFKSVAARGLLPAWWRTSGSNR
ncbi:ATP-dependent DNA helicase [Ottowia sp. GY511]|uniref:Helicase C-terminal domain-containing protein n=1 Tax=Ottowia flava TaxID=2675430 RepID=A0ABW4L2C9_9BURK|nr:ATP-dependent DNA helicase [Ottowia sp. GY511]TXK23427.1 ATP-dependent DNA helicase [Ottowia sp. GY511]